MAMMDELQAVFRSTYHDSSDRLTGSEFPAQLIADTEHTCDNATNGDDGKN